MLLKKVNDKNNIVEILEDDEDEALDEYINEEVLMKLENDNDDKTQCIRMIKIRCVPIHLRRSQTILKLPTEDLQDKG